MTPIDLKQVRRDLHRIPELALHETQTHQYLKQLVMQYEGWGVASRGEFIIREVSHL